MIKERSKAMDDFDLLEEIKKLQTECENYGDCDYYDDLERGRSEAFLDVADKLDKLIDKAEGWDL